MKLPFYYFFSKYSQIAIMLIYPKYISHLRYYGRKLYFGNINTFTIIEKGIKESNGIRKDIYLDADCYIDVGAHIGIKSIAFCFINKSAPCFAFEPTTPTYEFLKKNSEGLKRLKLFNVALGNKSSSTELYFDPSHLDVASLNKNHFFLKKLKKKNLCKQLVVVRRLNDFKKYFDKKKKIYLKIDAESYERDILMGASVVLNKVKYLDIEISQSNESFLSNTLAVLKRNYNILDVDFFLSRDSTVPKAVNLLLELHD